MLAPLTHILPLTLIRRERILPVPGKILVRKGQQVTATEIIGETRGLQEYSLIQVSRSLGVSVDQVGKYLQCEVGTKLVAGDVIAGPVGFTKRVIRATQKGKVVLAGDGQILIELEKSPLEVRAGMSGEITGLLADKGVVIETPGALVQGVWGNGSVDQGALCVLARTPDHLLTVDDLDASQRGKIILAGHCDDPLVLVKAAEVSIKGLILASLPISLYRQALRLSAPLILLEGFGKFPMNAKAFKLLSTHDQREVSLNAEMSNAQTGQRPEIIIPLPASSGLTQPRKTDFLTSQQRVRVLCSQHAREAGVIVQLKSACPLANGIRTQVAEIQLDSGEKAIIPLANLEILA